MLYPSSNGRTLVSKTSNGGSSPSGYVLSIENACFSKKQSKTLDKVGKAIHGVKAGETPLAGGYSCADAGLCQCVMWG